MGDMINDSLDLRKDYEVKEPRYDRLLSFVDLIITSAIEKRKIRIHSIKKRVKDYTSFLEKVERKHYDDPFRECTDLAGYRIVCLFQNQVDAIEEIIHNELEIVEESDKKSLKRPDQFGYLSLHLLVKIPKERLRFSEYSDLDGLLCEIQVRTILQEAWAEIEHYLNYKATKEQKDEALLRKIYSLAGLFEVADSTFEEINSGFANLVKQKLVSDEEITALSLFKLSKEMFPHFTGEWDKSQERRFYQLSAEIKKLNLNLLSELSKVIGKHKQTVDEYMKYHPDSAYNPSLLIRVALAYEYGTKFDMAFGLKGFSDSLKQKAKKQRR